MQPGRDPPLPPDGPSGPQATPLRATLHAKQRLRHTARFREAYDQDRRWHGRFMVLFLRQGPGASLRLGVVASRKVGNAVERARAKRRLREAFRRHRHQLATREEDVVLVARRSILSAPWPHVVAEWLRLAEQAGLLMPGRP